MLQLEKLEERRLLAVDLQTAFVSIDSLVRDGVSVAPETLASFLPSDTISVRTRFQSLGDELPKDIPFELRLSTDGAIDAGDLLLGTFTTETLSSTVEALLPGVGDPFWVGTADYTLGVRLDPNGETGDTDPSNNDNRGVGRDTVGMFLSFAPAAPGSFGAHPVSASEIALVWGEPPGNVQTIVIERSVEGGPFEFLAEVEAPARLFLDTGLTSGTEYAYRATAQNAFETGPMSLVATSAPQAVTASTTDSVLSSDAVADRVVTVTLNSAGRPVSYERVGNGAFDVRDLVLEAGGMPADAAVAWVQSPGEELMFAADVVTGSPQGRVFTIRDGVVGEYEHQPDCFWVHNDVSIFNDTSASVASNLETISTVERPPLDTGGTTEILYLTGLSDGGDVLLFARSASGWGVTNVSERARSSGIVVPQFVGEVSPVVTDWDAVHIFAADASGNTWAAWWAPGLSDWLADNVSASSSGTPIATSPTAVFMESGEIQSYATTADGTSVRLAWTARTGWSEASLTGAIPGGPTLSTSMRTVVTLPPWGGFNSFGTLSGAGDLVTFWNSSTDPSLKLSNLTSLTSASPDVSRSLAASSHDLGINIFGFTDSGEVLWTTFQVGTGLWTAQELTL